MGSRPTCLRILAVALLLSVSAATLNVAQAANGSVVYTYDALGRLTSASYDTGVCIAYTYDANSNRLSEKIVVSTRTTTGVWGCFNWNAAKWGP
jgi:YD repeat-containing protein